MIVVAVDVGTVRVGVAWGDTEVGLSFPVGVFPRAQGRAERSLLEFLAEKNASRVVIGLALGEQGEETELSENARRFAARLSKRSGVTTSFVDEAFSSEEAQERLAIAGVDRSELDAYAAAIILERFFADDSPQVESEP